jgi:diguanylate cyclase (GGDEF)-like protein
LDLWSDGTLRPLLMPGGFLLLVAVVLLESGIVSVPAAAIDSFYYVVFTAGIVLAWRFHSARVLFALVVLLLAHRALEFFSGGRAPSAGPGRIAFEAASFLLPLNFVALAWVRERGLTMATIAPRLGVLFIESVFVAVICRPGQITGNWLNPEILRPGLFRWTPIPQFAWVICIVVLAFLLVRFMLYRKPVEGGLLWSLVAAILGLQVGGTGPISSAYFATGGLILASSIVENSYALAYHDELTSLPARRAFNETLLRLEAPYTIAILDIDHFKRFNDTYGHDTGDHVLRMVATRLARVGGGGQTFRIGGEEFSVVFPGTTVQDALPHLESLRSEIETGSFRMRGDDRRRGSANATDRRKAVRRKSLRPRHPRAQSLSGGLSVTISIGVAEPSGRAREVEQVIQAADKALYRAKESGRNRVETATGSRQARPKREIA